MSERASAVPEGGRRPVREGNGHDSPGRGARWHEFAAADVATLTIEAPAGSTDRGGDAKLTAIRVGSLQVSQATP